MAVEFDPVALRGDPNLLEGLRKRASEASSAVRQLVPENLSSMQEQAPLSSQLPGVRPFSLIGGMELSLYSTTSIPLEILKRLQAQRLDASGHLPGGRSIPFLPPQRTSWKRGVQG